MTRRVRSMHRWLKRVALLGVASLSFTSCTCQRDLPDPPVKSVERKAGGFGASLTTPRKPPDRLAAARVTPMEQEAPEAIDTPTPTVAALPDDFPSGVPVYEDAEIFGVQELSQNGKNVLFYADDSAPQIFSYYKGNMQEEGWKVAQEYEAQEQSFLSFRKDGTITNLTIVKDPKSGRRVIAIMYYDEDTLPFAEF